MKETIVDVVIVALAVSALVALVTAFFFLFYPDPMRSLAATAYAGVALWSLTQ